MSDEQLTKSRLSRTRQYNKRVDCGFCGDNRPNERPMIFQSNVHFGSRHRPARICRVCVEGFMLHITTADATRQAAEQQS